MRVFFGVLELCAVVFVLWVVITQVILPSIRGTKLFPAVRARRVQELHKQAVEQEQGHYEQELEEGIRRRSQGYADTQPPVTEKEQTK